MASNYIPKAMRPHLLAIAYLREAHEEALSRMASLEARIAAQDRLIEQLILGESMAKSYAKETKESGIKRAKEAGIKAGLEGATDVVPVDIAQVPLQTISWLRGCAEGKRLRAKQMAACL